MATPTPAQTKRYRLKNPEKVKAWKRAYYARHRAKIRHRQNAHAKANKEAMNARRREIYATNEGRRTNQLASNTRWATKNRAQRRLYNAIYRVNNHIRLALKAKQDRLEHPEKFHAKYKRQYALHGERSRAMNRAYYAAHPELYSAWNRRYRQTHPEIVAEIKLRRLARIANAPRVEKIDRKRIYLRDGGICHICGLKVPRKERSLDHLIPLARGGNHTEDNVALAHRRCNSRRGAGRLPAQLRLFG